MATGGAEETFSSEETDYCDPCFVLKKVIKDPVFHCVDCGHQLCVSCQGHHSKTLITRNHKVEKLDKRNKTNPTKPSSLVQVSGSLPKQHDTKRATTPPSVVKLLKKEQKPIQIQQTNTANFAVSGRREGDETSRKSKQNGRTMPITGELNAQIKTDGVQCEIRGVVKLEHKLVVCDTGNSYLKVFDLAFTFLFEHACDGKPLDIDIIDDKTFVTSGRLINFFRFGHKCLIQIASINAGGTCIGVRYFDDELYGVFGLKVASNYSSLIQVYRKNGKLQRQFSPKGCNSMTYISINHLTSIIYVTDSNKGVVALTTNGDLIMTFQPENIELTGIAIDFQGSIYVCGSKLIRLSSDFQCLEYIKGTENSLCVKIQEKTMFVWKRNTGDILVDDPLRMH